ncbi:MAG: hypothetical protein ACREDN_09655 [Aestuariivirga sp.]
MLLIPRRKSKKWPLSHSFAAKGGALLVILFRIELPAQFASLIFEEHGKPC